MLRHLVRVPASAGMWRSDLCLCLPSTSCIPLHQHRPVSSKPHGSVSSESTDHPKTPHGPTHRHTATAEPLAGNSVNSPTPPPRNTSREYHAPEWSFERKRDQGVWLSGPNMRKWKHYNQVVWRPGTRETDGSPKRREVFHMMPNVSGDQDKMWKFTEFVVGMSVDEAVRQLSFLPGKFPKIALQLIEETREMALRDHNFQYRSNMWIADMFAIPTDSFKGYRRHARMRFGTVQLKFHHLFIRLAEGQPPPNWRQPLRKDGWEKADQYLTWLRSRHVILGL